jgi:hypothetical protein
MSTQYRLVQSGKTASGGCSAGQGSLEPVAPRIYLFITYLSELRVDKANDYSFRVRLYLTGVVLSCRQSQSVLFGREFLFDSCMMKLIVHNVNK